jgi:hypothetical protein
MKNHRQGRTEVASAAFVSSHARRLWLALLAISRQLRRAQRDPAVRRAYRVVEAELARRASSPKVVGRKRRRSR